MVNLGVSAGDNVAIISPNSIPFVELMFASAKVGAVSEHLNWRLAPVQICTLLEDSRPNIIFISSKCSAIYEYLKLNLSYKAVFVSLDGVIGTESGYEIMMAAQPDTFSDPSIPETNPGILLYTNGTTGRQKGVVHSVKNVVTKVMMMVLDTCWIEHEVFLCVLPLFHSACITVFEAVAVGGTIVFSDASVEAIAQNIEKHRVTRVSLVPSVIKQLLGYLKAHQMDTDSLRVIDYGGSCMSPELLKDCNEFFHCGFYQGYGMTETLTTLTSLTPESHNDPARLCTVGIPMLGTTLKIVDDNGQECRPLEPGLILAKHPTVMMEYLHNPDLTREVIQDGWYHTNDVGYLDPDGFLRLIGRKNDLIISGGENIYPQEISQCIRSMGDHFVEVEVIGVSDPVYDEVVMAAVVKKPESSVSAEEIIQHCKSNLGSFKKPKYVHFLDAIPRDSMGKVSKNGLLDIHNKKLEEK